MRRACLLAALPLVLALAVAGCGGSSTPAASTPTSGVAVAPAPSTAPALNPVELIRKAGGTPAPGAAVGSLDAQGNHVASGTIGPEDGGVFEQITAYAWTGTPWPEKPSTDSNWYVRGDGYEVELTGYLDTATGGVVFPVTAEQVATALGGQVVPQG